MVFIEEEKERYLEAQIELSVGKAAGEESAGQDDDPQSALSATLKSMESIKGGERLMDALDLVEAELTSYFAWEKQQKNAVTAAAPTGSKVNTKRPPPVAIPPPKANPILLGMHPYKYMMHQLKSIKQPDLEQALLVMPFHYIHRLIKMLVELTRRNMDIELCARCAVFLIKVHNDQITASHSLISEISDLREIITNSLSEYRLIIGANVVGLRMMSRFVEGNRTAYFVDFEPPTEESSSSFSEKSKKRKGDKDKKETGSKKKQHSDNKRKKSH